MHLAIGVDDSMSGVVVHPGRSHMVTRVVHPTVVFARICLKIHRIKIDFTQPETAKFGGDGFGENDERATIEIGQPPVKFGAWKSERIERSRKTNATGGIGLAFTLYTKEHVSTFLGSGVLDEGVAEDRVDEFVRSFKDIEN